MLLLGSIIFPVVFGWGFDLYPYTRTNILHPEIYFKIIVRFH